MKPQMKRLKHFLPMAFATACLIVLKVAFVGSVFVSSAFINSVFINSAGAGSALVESAISGGTVGNSEVADPKTKDPSTKGAGQFLTQLSQKALQQLAEPSANAGQVEASFKKMYIESFDTKALPYLVLGAYWRKLQKPQRAEFSELFEDFLATNYALKFRDLDIPSFVIQNVYEVKQGVFNASTTIHDAKGEPVEVDWRIRFKGGYKIYDITIGGISLVTTHRNDFGEYIRNHNGDATALIENLKLKTAQ